MEEEQKINQLSNIVEPFCYLFILYVSDIVFHGGKRVNL